MSEYTGYSGKSLEFLKSHDVAVGDSVKILGDLTYLGIIMPRYEHSDDKHIVLKLNSGYNIGLEIDKLVKIEKVVSATRLNEKIFPPLKENQSLPKILLLSTGGTIASKVDYRTGAVTPILTAEELNLSVPELAKIANIDTEVLFSEYSENIMPEHWEKIADKLIEYSNSDYSGDHYCTWNRYNALHIIISFFCISRISYTYCACWLTEIFRSCFFRCSSKSNWSY